MMKKYFFTAFIFLLLISAKNFAQVKAVDSISTKRETKDSAIKKIHSPKVAAIRSALLPGLGQIYNKKYWKLPIVYGALGVTAGIFIFNLNNYHDTKFAYRVKYNMRANHTDSTLYP